MTDNLRNLDTINANTYLDCIINWFGTFCYCFVIGGFMFVSPNIVETTPATKVIFYVLGAMMGLCGITAVVGMIVNWKKLTKLIEEGNLPENWYDYPSI